ncbi:hypothetical protein [Fimbriiglobus ruber]|uniref:Deoxyguanosinetriphosphate triphosphohydrolase n=1 Tax=Fimbriiglobus ruber TaxID=1908690 RepID=A0A225E2V3_9BACT|nr:hypothetical protein [Fimbriiglobus ruber]OWK45118.1 Deoxyguanosinetriphosphate triphosphohydrolase [Fimbriiglobus ruber]
MEERYPEFPGLNLTFELREAFVRHSGRPDAPAAAEFRDAGGPLVEAQVVDAVDSIAYDTHDVDDALGLGLITQVDLHEVEFWARAAAAVRAAHPTLSGNPFRTAVVRELLARQVTDLLGETSRRLADCGIASVDDVRAATFPLVGLGADMERIKGELEAFLRERVYRHHRVLRMTASGKRVLRALFAEYVSAPELLPDKHLRRWAGSNRVVGPPAGPLLPGGRWSRTSNGSSVIISPA